MKNLHLIVFAYADRGHTKEYVTNFCTHLQDKFNITIYIASTKPVEEPKNVECVYIDTDITKLKAEKFLKYGKLSNLAKNIAKQGLIVKYCRKVLSLKKIHKNDVVYIMDYTAPSLYVLFKGLSKIKPKVFLWIHSARFKSTDIIYSIYKKAVQAVFNVYGSKTLAGIVVNGDYIKEKLPEHLSFDPKKIHIIQYPSEIGYSKIDKKLARERLDLALSEDIVLFFGGLRTDKNIEEVVKSTSNAKNKPLLIVAGSESTVSKQQLLEWLKKHNHQNYFLDISYVSEEKMALYYSASDVLLLTYGAESASQSGPLSLAREFLLPAIVTDTGEIGYYIKSNAIGLVSSPSLENDFAKKIESFFDKSLSEKFRPALNKAKEKFSWDNAAKKYETIFGNSNSLN